MKRILQLIRCEFVKDFSLVKIALCGVILFLVSWIFLSFVSNIYYRYHETPREFYQENVDYIIQERDNAIADNAAEPMIKCKRFSGLSSEINLIPNIFARTYPNSCTILTAIL